MFNNGFPVTYPQLMYPAMQQQPAQGMSAPTIHADIVQVSGEQEAWNYPVAAGNTQMMMDRDDTAIYVKTAFPNSQPTLEIFRKEETRKQQDYVTRDELEEMIRQLTEGKDDKK